MTAMHLYLYKDIVMILLITVQTQAGLDTEFLQDYHLNNDFHDPLYATTIYVLHDEADNYKINDLIDKVNAMLNQTVYVITGDMKSNMADSSDTRLSDYNIDQDHSLDRVLRFSKGCSKEAAKVCTKACRYAYKDTCSYHDCSRSSKKYFKKNCKTYSNDYFNYA